MDNKPNMIESNPLKKYFRQPKMFIQLPSGGKFYSPGSLNMPETGELPVFAMTAKDELIMKTPDALLNGQATVDVIQSCIPNIVDAWSMPSIDLDAVLIAIRIATYGDSMDITSNIPGLNEERDFVVNLRKLLVNLSSVEFNPEISIGEMTVTIRPLTYKEFTANSLKTFEEQRVFSIVNNADMSDIDKLKQFNVSFKKLTELTITSIAQSITKIQIGDTEVTNSEYIMDFINNSDKEFYKNVIDHIEEQKSKFELEPLQANFSPEDIEKGAPETYEIPITFDQSNFFV